MGSLSRIAGHILRVSDAKTALKNLVVFAVVSVLLFVSLAASNPALMANPTPYTYLYSVQTAFQQLSAAPLASEAPEAALTLGISISGLLFAALAVFLAGYYPSQLYFAKTRHGHARSAAYEGGLPGAAVSHTQARAPRSPVEEWRAAQLGAMLKKLDGYSKQTSVVLARFEKNQKTRLLKNLVQAFPEISIDSLRAQLFEQQRALHTQALKEKIEKIEEGNKKLKSDFLRILHEHCGMVVSPQELDLVIPCAAALVEREEIESKIPARAQGDIEECLETYLEAMGKGAHQPGNLAHLAAIIADKKLVLGASPEKIREEQLRALLAEKKYVQLYLEAALENSVRLAGATSDGAYGMEIKDEPTQTEYYIIKQQLQDALYTQRIERVKNVVAERLIEIENKQKRARLEGVLGIGTKEPALQEEGEKHGEIPAEPIVIAEPVPVAGTPPSMPQRADLLLEKTFGKKVVMKIKNYQAAQGEKDPYSLFDSMLPEEQSLREVRASLQKEKARARQKEQGKALQEENSQALSEPMRETKKDRQKRIQKLIKSL